MNERKYKRLYKMFNNVTALYADCGTVCNKRCCTGDENTGMLLFPFENTVFDVKEENNIRLAVCNGKCNRAERPLSCRIFPFFPIMNEYGKVEAVIDSRGYGICPLIRHSEQIKFDRRFLRAVRRAGRILYRDEDTREFMKSIKEEIYSQKNLIDKLVR